MELKNIEQHLDPRIRERAVGYIQDGRIEAPEPITSDVWRTTVHGSDLYHVVVQLDGEKIVRWECSCPYDQGPICKHVAALLLLLEGKEEADAEMEHRTPARSKPGKRAIDIILDEAPIEGLREFIRDYALTDMDLKNKLKARFAEYLDASPASTYSDMVRNHIRTARDRRGFIDYHSAKHLIQSLNHLWNTAENLLDRGKPLESLELCKILIEGVADALQQMDDSSGGASDILYGAFEILGLISVETTTSTKQKMFKWCIKEVPKQKYRDFSLDDHFLELLPNVTTPDAEREFMKYLETRIKQQREKPYPEYGLKKLISTKVTYLKVNGRGDEATELILASAHMAFFRMMLVEKAIEKREFEHAKTLCREGIRLAEEKGHPGTVDQWQECLFQIAQLGEDGSEMKRLAEHLFYSQRLDMKWYRQLKSLHDPDTWAVKRDKILGGIEPNRLVYSTTLAAIYIEEDFKEQLLTLVQDLSSDITFTEHFGFKLMDTYPNEILDAYVKGIVEYAKQTGRKHYRSLGGYLDKLRTFNGGTDRARTIVTRLLQEYSNRPAMREELQRYFPEWIPN